MTEARIAAVCDRMWSAVQLRFPPVGLNLGPRALRRGQRVRDGVWKEDMKGHELVADRPRGEGARNVSRGRRVMGGEEEGSRSERSGRHLEGLDRRRRMAGTASA